MTRDDTHPVYLTQRELADRLRLTGRTLERWRADHRGPAWVQAGGAIRYRMKDVLAWEDANRNETNRRRARS